MVACVCVCVVGVPCKRQGSLQSTSHVIPNLARVASNILAIDFTNYTWQVISLSARLLKRNNAQCTYMIIYDIFLKYTWYLDIMVSYYCRQMWLSKYNCMYGKTHHLDSLIFHQKDDRSDCTQSQTRHVGYVQVLMHYAKVPPGVQRFLEDGVLMSDMLLCVATFYTFPSVDKIYRQISINLR